MSVNGWLCVTFYRNVGKQTRKEGQDDFAFILKSKYQRTRQRPVRIFHWYSSDTEDDVKENMRRPRPTLQMKEILKMYKQPTNAL
jgi:hypothetical protein